MDKPIPAGVQAANDLLDVMRPNNDDADRRAAGVDAFLRPRDRAGEDRICLPFQLHHVKAAPRDVATPGFSRRSRNGERERCRDQGSLRFVMLRTVTGELPG
jgi:hypothetical protein